MSEGVTQTTEESKPPFNDGATREHLTLWEGVKELGWFTWIFAIAAGGPSILSILQKVFNEHRLVDGLQWIVDGYNTVVQLAANVIEPALHPLLDWVGKVVGLDLHLYSHWRPIAVLWLMLQVASARAALMENATTIRWFLAARDIALAFACSLLVGLVPLQASPWLQAIVPALLLGPIVPETLALGISLGSKIGVVVVAVVLCAIPALIAFRFPEASAPGLLTFGAFVFLVGAVGFLGGLINGARYSLRYGLLILGGFLAAGVILGANAIVSELGQSAN